VQIDEFPVAQEQSSEDGCRDQSLEIKGHWNQGMDARNQQKASRASQQSTVKMLHIHPCGWTIFQEGEPLTIIWPSGRERKRVSSDAKGTHMLKKHCLLTK
jgi:hypothetical protein